MYGEGKAILARAGGTASLSAVRSMMLDYLERCGGHSRPANKSVRLATECKDQMSCNSTRHTSNVT